MRFFEHVCKIILGAALLSAVGRMPVAAQTIDFGIKAGVPVTDPFVVNDQASGLTNYIFKTQRYTFGPTLELHLPYSLAVEGDALYKPLRYVSYPFGFDSFSGTILQSPGSFRFSSNATLAPAFIPMAMPVFQSAKSGADARYSRTDSFKPPKNRRSNSLPTEVSVL